MNTAVLVLYSGGIDREHLASMQGLNGAAGVCSVHDHPLISHARSYLASLALANSKADVLVWVDDDIVFDAHDLLALAELCRQGHPLIGAAYPSREAQGLIIGGGEYGAEAFASGAVLPVPWLGMGFTAIHRKVYEAVAATLPDVRIASMHNYVGKPFFACAVEGGTFYGEDVSFCRRAAAVGFPSEVDTRIRVGHKGHRVYQLEDTGSFAP